MTVRITIKLFAQFREAVGVGKMERDITDGLMVGALLDQLRAEYPGLEATGKTIISSVNQKFVPIDTVLHDGDEVAIFPPVSGGKDLCRVTQDPITVDEVVAAVTRPHTGAVAVFVGVVRDRSGGRAVDHLEYEAYDEMAQAMMGQIVAEIRQKWPSVVNVAIVQRVGLLPVGQTAAVIAVSSPHRDDGCFEACRYAIDRLKQIVPVWKEEVGPDGRSWIEGDHVPHPS